MNDDKEKSPTDQGMGISVFLHKLFGKCEEKKLRLKAALH